MIQISPAILVLAAAIALWLASVCSGTGDSTEPGTKRPRSDGANQALNDDQASLRGRFEPGSVLSPKPYSGPAWFDPEGFSVKTAAKPGDWLACYPEKGRSFRAYRRSGPPRAGKTRRVLALQPLGPFSEEDRRLLRTAADFASLYFQSAVRIQTGVSLPRKDRRERQAMSGSGTFWQYYTEWILRILQGRLSDDAMALLGVTMEDLYPEPTWNYVFGVASLDERVGVYSLARYQPSFWGKLDTRAGRKRALLRTLKVLAHETAHMLGIVHCIRYECVVNGSNSLEEADRQPLYLCPDCLRKLAWNRGFDIAARYRALAMFYRKHDLEAEAKFAEGRLARGQ